MRGKELSLSNARNGLHPYAITKLYGTTCEYFDGEHSKNQRFAPMWSKGRINQSHCKYIHALATSDQILSQLKFEIFFATDLPVLVGFALLKKRKLPFEPQLVFNNLYFSSSH